MTAMISQLWARTLDAVRKRDQAGGTWMNWSSAHPGVIEQTKSKGTANDGDVTGLRAAYQSGRLRLIGKTKLQGRAVYRLEVVPPRNVPNWARRAEANPSDVLVDASTFLPVESIDYARDRHGRLVPSFVLRYPVTKELPATLANLALLNMAPHPGAQVLARR